MYVPRTLASNVHPRSLRDVVGSRFSHASLVTIRNDSAQGHQQLQITRLGDGVRQSAIKKTLPLLRLDGKGRAQVRVIGEITQARPSRRVTLYRQPGIARRVDCGSLARAMTTHELINRDTEDTGNLINVLQREAMLACFKPRKARGIDTQPPGEFALAHPP